MRNATPDATKSERDRARESCAARVLVTTAAQQVRIVGGAPLRYKTGHSKHCRFCARCGDERAQEHALGAHDANLFRVNFDALGERAEVIAAVAAALGSHAL